MRAQVGARSADMKRWPLPGRMLGAKIISIGTNDAAQPLLAANLKAIRVRLNTRRAIWLYPTQEVRPVSCALWPRPSATRYPILAATARKTVPIRKATVTSREHGFASKQSSAPTATANSSIAWRWWPTMIVPCPRCKSAVPGLVIPTRAMSSAELPPGRLCICPGRLRLKAQAHVSCHVTSPGSRASRGGIGRNARLIGPFCIGRLTA